MLIKFHSRIVFLKSVGEVRMTRFPSKLLAVDYINTYIHGRRSKRFEPVNLEWEDRDKWM